MASIGNSTSHITVTKNKHLYTTSNPFEQTFGYHRAVRRGPYIAVSGTTALKLQSSTHEAQETQGENSRVEFPGNAFKQAKLAMDRCVEGVERLNGQKEDVIRVRMLVANYDDCGEVGRAFGECFGTKNIEVSSKGPLSTDAIGAAATMIVVKDGFVDKDILVEVEVDAFCL